MTNFVKKDRICIEDLESIKPGQSKFYILPTHNSVESAMVQAYKMPFRRPSKKILRYSCKSDYKPTDDGFLIRITAIRR